MAHHRLKMIKSILLAALVWLIATTVVMATEPLRIGVSLGLTGNYAKPAKMQKMAYQLWEMEINKKGGFYSRKVEVIKVDDNSDFKKAQEIYRDLILKTKVDLVFGPYSSGITKAVAPIVNEQHYPMLAAGAAADSIWQQGYKNVFGMWIPASRYSTGILELALLNDLKTVAIVYADDEFSTEVARGAKKWVPFYGLNLVMFEKFKKGVSDLSPLAQKARDARAELLIVGGHFNESVDMRRALKRIGWYPKAFFATVGPAMDEYRRIMGTDAEFTFGTSIWEPRVPFPRSKEFAALFKSTYHRDPSYHAATAYAAGQILEAAIELAGSLKLDMIRQAMLDLDYTSIIGRYAVDRTGMQIKCFPLIIQWQNGKKMIVWPDDVRTALPIFK
jgi:branched-chain amino acid transport system substrate-binding protein